MSGVACKPWQCSRQVTGGGDGGVRATSVCCEHSSGPTNITSQSVSELSDWSQDVATMRTLTFGDRTISYEAGLDSLQPGSKSGEARLYCGLAVKLEIPTQSMTGELSSEDCLSVSLHTVLFASPHSSEPSVSSLV